MKIDGAFGPRHRPCVSVNFALDIKSYVACFMIQSKLQS